MQKDKYYLKDKVKELESQNEKKQQQIQQLSQELHKMK